MTSFNWKAVAAAIVLGAALAPVYATCAEIADVLDTPAQMSPLASKSLLQAVARAGPSLVAVGQRGHIVVSSDGGATWKQASVPVSSDLTAVFFVGDRKGWAVGHDGVVLFSSDGGLTWTLQLEGRKANERLVEYMQVRATASPQSADTKQLLEEARRYKDQGPDKPFLDVWFADENNGYVVGAYNLIFRTSDGGKNWEPWFDQTDNPKLLNLYAIRPAAGGLYIAGESGLVLKLDPDAQRFKALTTPYKGSFFGVVGDASAVLVFGLRGNVYRSDDGGKSWAKVDAELPATIASGASLPKDVIILGDVGGRLALSDNAGRDFKPATVSNPMPLAGIADAGNGRVALVGPRGVAVAELAVPK
ncbi:MAG TPA: YCF48-related protein [Casimicrobiaceae bacterium]|nr:YCF48-related protein [Casimicrobiaceae bacterium]